MERKWLIPALVAVAGALCVPVHADEKADTPKPEPAVAQAQPAPAEQPQNREENDATPAAPKFTYGGSADFYYTHNFNDPFNDMNQLRAFDIFDDGDPHLGLIDLWAQYARSPVGFRLDLDWGVTARLVNAFEPSDDDLWEHVQQAFVSVNLNKKGDTYLDFGKWVTPAGAEVIEPKDNVFYSRGLLFTWAIPFYHMGARVYHYYNSTDYIMAHVNRGWNAVGSPGHGPGFGVTYSRAANKKLTFTGNYIGGPEVLGNEENWRNLVDLIAIYTPNSRWQWTFNTDFGQQTNNQWYGVSAIAKYTLNSKSYAAVRGEWLRDNGGALFGTSMDAYSATVNYTRYFNKYLQGRVEYRHDFAGGSDPFASDRVGRFKDNQGTFIISAIASYN